MPHSSGGGSSGGGFHSGGSSGSSNHISSHYFPGARRYRRYYSDGRPDEYVYANSKPGKTGIASLVIVALMGLIFIAASGFAAFSDRPKFLTPKYSDDPAIHDTVGVFEDEEELLELMKKYNKTTGICPVIFTVFDEEWNRDYPSLEKYAFDKYVSNFKDEQHFVFVYSIPAGDAKFNPGGLVTSTEFKWEAIQGDETDNLLTESVFRRIGKAIQNDLEAGKGPQAAFVSGFKTAITNAENMLKPGSPKRIFSAVRGSMPLVICLAIFIPMFILMFKSYKKDLAMTVEEVPLDVEPVPVPGLSTFINGNGGTVTEYKSQGYYEKSVNYSAANPAASKFVTIISLVMLIPFVLVGIGVTAGGASLLNSGNADKTGGIFMIFFGIAWTVISLAILISLLGVASKAKKKMPNPLTAEYPKAEYPDMKPVTPSPQPVTPAQQPEFDPQYFGTAKSDYESDDEDYRRMKRKGYE